MGVFSKYHRFREAGEEANVNNVEKFGQPVRSLFTSTKVFTLHHHIDVTDEAEQIIYQSETKILTLHDRTYVKTADGQQIAHIWRKIFTLHQRHFIEMSDGTTFQVSTELFHLVKDINNIEGLGWQLRGNVFGLNFELYDADENIIAVISQKLISLHDKYCIDLYQPDKEGIVVAILITLQHMIRDREAARSSASSSFSSSSASAGSN